MVATARQSYYNQRLRSKFRAAPHAIPRAPRYPPPWRITLVRRPVRLGRTGGQRGFGNGNPLPLVGIHNIRIQVNDSEFVFWQ